MTGIFIQDQNECLIEVTDINEAFTQAKQAVHWHDMQKLKKQTDPTALYFPRAHKHWNYVLFQLEKIKIKNR